MTWISGEPEVKAKKNQTKRKIQTKYFQIIWRNIKQTNWETDWENHYFYGFGIEVKLLFKKVFIRKIFLMPDLSQDLSLYPSPPSLSNAMSNKWC